MKITVVQQDIPHLLSIGLLESLGSIIDIKGNVLKYENYDAEDQMHRMSSGHRTIDVTKWEGGEFPVPQQLRDQYGLPEGSFNLETCYASEAYMELLPQLSGRVGLQTESIITHVHHIPRRSHYMPHVEDHKNLEDVRVTLKRHEDGSLSHSVDTWRLAGDRQVEDPWTGITVFVKKLAKDSMHQRPLCSKFEVAPSGPSYAIAASLDAAGSAVSMSAHGDRAVGEGGPPGQGEDQRREAMSPSTQLRGAGAQPVRGVGSMPTLQDEASIPALLFQAGRQEEGQEGQRDCLCGDGSTPGAEAGAESQGRSSFELPAHGSGGPASVFTGVEPAAAHGDVDGAGSGNYPVDVGATGSARDDAAVNEQSDHADLHRAADPGSNGSGDDGDDSTTTTSPRRGGVGERVRSPAVPLMHFATAPNTACRLHHGLPRYARKTFFMEQDDIKVAWSTPELKDYFEDEDINDDYECGVSTGVRRATREAEGFMDEDTDQEPNREPSPTPPPSPDVLMEFGEERVVYKVMELFSPPRVTAEIMTGGYRNIGHTEPAAFDKDCGWDFFDAQDRKMFWQCFEEQQPDLVIMTPVCRAFSILMNSNWDRMDEVEKEKLQKACMTMFQFCVQVADEQLSRGKEFLLEQPDGASSWNTHAAVWLAKQEQVLHIAFDQCMLGLQVHPAGPSKKRTAFMLNHLGIADEIVQYQCDGSHVHVKLEGGLPLLAQVWPQRLIRTILAGILRQLEWSGVEVEESESEESPEHEEQLDDDQPNQDSTVVREQELSQAQKDLVKRLHHNMGHLPVERMVTMLKAAKAQPKVLKFVRDKFNCETCMKQRRQVSRRRAAFPRTFEFNRIVGADVFFVRWGNKKVPFLNLVDHGSNWQCVAMVRPAEGGEPTNGNPKSADTWHWMMSSWIRPHGAPEVLVTDGGMEFRGRFERGLEQLSVLHNVTDIQSPWQNGRVERHGQWIKDRVELELASGSSILENLNDLDNLIMELVSCKNIWFSRGGYSPAQIVYGRNPRLPPELLSDADQASPGWSDILCDPTEMDTAAAEFKRAHRIREQAKKLAMEHTSKEKLRDAAKPPMHRYRTWTAGQWVLVWRIAQGSERARWVGPGLVILQNGHTVYVAMRSRLWKCNTDQLRPATATEELGMQVVLTDQYRDLLQQMRGQRAGAVDVAREGAPSDNAWRTAPAEGEEASTLSRTGDGSETTDSHAGTEASSDRSRPGTGTGHLLRTSSSPATLGPPSADTSPNVRRGMVRRHSLDTVSEPLSEPSAATTPRGDGAEDAEGKRRKVSKEPLPTIEETRTTPQEPQPGRPPGQEEVSSSSNDPRTYREARVRERVQEIESRPHMTRRRSRSPLPEVLRRQIGGPPRIPPDTMGGPATDLNADELYVPGKREHREIFKEHCIAYNEAYFCENGLDLGELPIEALFELEPQGPCEEMQTGPKQIWATEQVRNGEITWSQMTPDEVLEFKKSDLTEWNDLENGFQAVKVWKGGEAKDLREKYKHRIMTSRMVRRKKPMPGLHKFKAKSRFCVHGHKDPDGGTFRTFAPTPSSEALNMVCQVIANENLHLLFADVKAAFAQSDKLARPRGRLFVEPCDGVPVEKGDLIELVQPVYGLDDAPLRWFETVTRFLRSMGLRKSLLDPCVYVQHNEHNELVLLILIEVDDFIVAAKDEKIQQEAKDKLMSRFRFGKWEVGEADFIGRHIKKEGNEIRMDQEKYIIEKMEAVHLSKGRRSNKDAPLQEEEFKDFRSMLYRASRSLGSGIHPLKQAPPGEH